VDAVHRDPETILGALDGPVAKVDGVDILDADAPPEILGTVTVGGSSARDRVSQWIYYRATNPGITNAEVARRLNIAPGTLNTILSRARKAGWLKIENPMDRIEFELIPKIVENLNTFLDKGDRTVTIEAAKGVLFPQYRESKGIVENKIAVLGINIQMPEGEMALEPVRRGAIAGIPKPAALEAEIISGKSEP
jgi:Winged helix-turn-helix DNA-binding